MTEDRIQIYCGTGTGRSAAAIGQGVRYACAGKSVFVVRFLKGKASAELDYLKRLEPEIKLFCFDKFDANYNDLSPDEQQEEQIHIRNGISYAKKVLVTEECDVLILDELLGVVAMGIVSADEVKAVIESAGEDVVILMTGTDRCEQLWPLADRVTELINLKEE